MSRRAAHSNFPEAYLGTLRRTTSAGRAYTTRCKTTVAQTRKFRPFLPRRFPLSFADPAEGGLPDASLNVSNGQGCSACGLCHTVEELHTSDPKRTMANQLYYGDNLQVLRDSVSTESVDLVYLDQSKREKLF